MRERSLVMGPGDWALLIALSLLWGGSFFFAEIALYELPPFTIVLGRVAIAAVVLNGLVILAGHRMPRDRRLWSAFLAMGLLNNAIPFSLIVWGQTEITSGRASILNATTPLFAVLLAHGFTADEKLTAHRLVGVVAGFAGVVLMVGPAALAGLGGTALAEIAVLGAAFAYGIASLFGRRFGGVAPIVTASGQVSCSTVLMLPVVLAVDRPWTLAPPGAATWSALIGLAVLSTALAYILYFKILARAGATNLMLVTFLIPISAMLLGTTFLDERIAPGQIAGMALIGAGLAAIDGRALRLLRVFLGPRRSGTGERDQRSA